MTYRSELSRSRSFWSIHEEQALWIKTQQKCSLYFKTHGFSIKIEIICVVSPWFGMPLLTEFYFSFNKAETALCTLLQACTESFAAASDMFSHSPSYLLFGPWLSNIWTHLEPVYL